MPACFWKARRVGSRKENAAASDWYCNSAHGSKQILKADSSCEKLDAQKFLLSLVVICSTQPIPYVTCKFAATTSSERLAQLYYVTLSQIPTDFGYCQKYHVQLSTKLHRHRNIYYKTFVFGEGEWAPGARGFMFQISLSEIMRPCKTCTEPLQPNLFSLIFDVCLVLFVCWVLLLSVLFLVTTWLRGARNKIRDFHLQVNSFILAQNSGTYVK